jgi:hypothetical protein
MTFQLKESRERRGLTAVRFRNSTVMKAVDCKAARAGELGLSDHFPSARRQMKMGNGAHFDRGFTAEGTPLRAKSRHAPG